jgi:hypothetical protein
VQTYKNIEIKTFNCSSAIASVLRNALMHCSYPAAPADDMPQWNLDPVIQALRTSREEKHNIRHNGRVRELPSREVLTTIFNGLSVALLPIHYQLRIFCPLEDKLSRSERSLPHQYSD